MNDKLIKIGDKTYKEAKVIMLPAEAKTISGIVKHIHADLNTLHFKNNGMVYQHEDYYPQHLHIINSEEIKKGDWYYNERLNQVFQALGYAKYNTVDKEYKIISSTDHSLITKEYDDLDEKGQKQYCNKSLPRPSDDFIKKFVELNGEIKDVLVEYEGIEWLDKPLEYFLKVAPDNTISIIKKQDLGKLTGYAYSKMIYKKALSKLSEFTDEELEYFVNFQNKEEEKLYSKTEILEKVNQWFSEEASVKGLDSEPIDRWLSKNL